MRDNFNYTGEHQSCISFPLGGIGSGCIGLAGNGHLKDWEIFNRPDKGRYNGFSHFAVKVEDEQSVLGARVLHGDLQPPYTGPLGRPNFYEGFGFGPLRETLAGMPHFVSNSFRGTFPIAQLNFEDEKFPCKVTMEAFNPLIPHEADDSSIPAAFFEFRLKNTNQQRLHYSLVGVLGNPYQGTIRNRFFQRSGVSAILLESLNPEADDIAAGNLCLATDAESVSYQEYLFRSEWYDTLDMYWNDMLTFGPFENRQYEAADSTRRDNALLCAGLSLNPGESGRVRFIISWYHPINRNTWTNPGTEKERYNLKRSWKNYYAVLWSDSHDSASYGLRNWDRLYGDTEKFRSALFSSTLPEAVIDAVSANIAVLKSPTVWRLEDGTLYGWEGVGEKAGSCEGSCTHVWSYAQALPFLFPKLSRSMRLAEYRYNWSDDGSMSFRLMLPIVSPRRQFRPAADGQFATIMKVYREWRICGNDAWLSSLWPRVKASLEFAWSPENSGRWDPQKRGILTGQQHHTLDMELYGPNSWLSGMYLGALKAGMEMARAMGEEDSAAEYRDIYTKGAQFLNKELFNGEYFIQQIDLNDQSILLPFVKDESFHWVHGKSSLFDVYWSDEIGELKYQLGEGVLIDQLLGQWHADIYGLGEIFDSEKARSALDSIFRNNFRITMRDHYNPCRIYCLNDESGMIICSWPEGKKRPKIPVPYSQETMHGFEYAAADLMLRRGLTEQGLKIIEAVRNRYDGRRRNPWNEMECGSNYARSMASYALMLTFSGFEFDGRFGRISFRPPQKRDFFFFWSCGSAWGSISLNDEKVVLDIMGGEFHLRSLGLPEYLNPGSLKLNGENISFQLQNSSITLQAVLLLGSGDSLVIQP